MYALGDALATLEKEGREFESFGVGRAVRYVAWLIATLPQEHDRLAEQIYAAADELQRAAFGPVPDGGDEYARDPLVVAVEARVREISGDYGEAETIRETGMIDVESERGAR